jgi:trimeric autotransporter adhesin
MPGTQRKSTMNSRTLALLAILSSILLPYAASQTEAPTPAASALTAVPPLVPYSGQVEGRTGQTSATFLIYKDQTGGEPLFTESQIVSLDPTGHYKVQLGAANPNGLPFDLFATGEARWLEVQIAGQPAEPRTLLASVPYALKAADAATLGGLPASAFALAGSNTAVANVLPGGVSPDAATTVTTTGGTANKVAKFSGANTIVNSILYDNGTEVGIGTTSPTATLTVDGTVALDGATTFNGAAVLGATGTATSTHSYSSQLLKAYTSAYNSSTKAVVQPRFEWQAEVKGNNTSTPAGTLNLLESNTATGAVETGFYFNSDGTINFAPGQTFPGTGDGTITGVTAGTDLTGGGTSGNVTLKLDTTKVPLLAANNAFTGNQTITGNLTASGTATARVVNATVGFDLGGQPFAFGSQASFNAYLGFAGNSSTTGTDNTASGFGALMADTTGSENSASGSYALYFNTTGNRNTANGDVALNNNITGNFNTASGFGALFNNTSGDSNTASGIQALYYNTTGFSNTASGSYALTSNTTGANNTASGQQALYLNTTGENNTASGFQALPNNTTGTSNTAIGSSALVRNTTGSDNTASGQAALPNNTAGDANVGIGLNAGSVADGSNMTGSGNTAVGTNTVFRTGALSNATAIGAGAEVDQSNALVLGCVQSDRCPSAVLVGIGTTTPDAVLSVAGNADKVGGGSWDTYSDGRLKNVNGSFASGLDQVMLLRPIRYRYKPGNGMGIRDREEHIGVVAQEIQRVIPEAVTENGRGYLLVNNDPVIWSMVNAIKEQQREIEQQQKLLRAQSAVNEQQAKLLRAQGTAMQNLAAEVRETRKTLRQVKAQAAAGQLIMVAAK